MTILFLSQVDRLVWNKTYDWDDLRIPISSKNYKQIITLSFEMRIWCSRERYSANNSCLLRILVHKMLCNVSRTVEAPFVKLRSASTEILYVCLTFVAASWRFRVFTYGILATISPTGGRYCVKYAIRWRNINVNTHTLLYCLGSSPGHQRPGSCEGPWAPRNLSPKRDLCHLGGFVHPAGLSQHGRHSPGDTRRIRLYRGNRYDNFRVRQ